MGQGNGTLLRFLSKLAGSQLYPPRSCRSITCCFAGNCKGVTSLRTMRSDLDHRRVGGRGRWLPNGGAQSSLQHRVFILDLPVHRNYRTVYPEDVKLSGGSVSPSFNACTSGKSATAHVIHQNDIAGHREHNPALSLLENCTTVPFREDPILVSRSCMFRQVSHEAKCRWVESIFGLRGSRRSSAEAEVDRGGAATGGY